MTICYILFCNNSFWVASVGNTWVCKGLSWVAHLIMFVRDVCSHGLVQIGEILDLVGQGSACRSSVTESL